MLPEIQKKLKNICCYLKNKGKGWIMRFKIHIKKEDIIWFFVLLAFLEPWWFITISGLDLLINIFKLCCGGYVFYKMIHDSIHVRSFFTLFAVYRGFIVIRTIMCGSPEWTAYLTESIQWLIYIYLLEILIVNKNRQIISILTNILAVILFLNVITWTPNGLLLDPGQGYFLLGVRTRIADVAIPAMGLFLFEKKLKKEKGFSFKGVIIFGSSILFFILEWVATGLVCTALLIALYLILKNRKLSGFRDKVLIISSCGLTVGVVFFQIQEKFSWLLSGILQKDISLTGRTEIWDVALAVINKQLWFGYGYTNHGNFVALYDFVTSGHSQMIQVLYYGGIVGMVLLLVLLFSVVRKAIKAHYKEISILLCTFVVIVIETISEICMDNLYFITLLVVMEMSVYLKGEINVRKNQRHSSGI